MKKQSMKKLICLLLVGMISSSYACGSSSSKDEGADSTVDSSVNSDTPNYTEESYAFTTVFTDGDTVSLNAYNPDVPNENGNVVYDVFSNIQGDNYLKMELETDVNVVGYINYYNNSNPSETNSEKFYIEAMDIISHPYSTQ